MLSGAVREEVWGQMHDDLERLTEGLGEVNIIGSGGNINKLYRLAEKKDKKKLRLPVTSLQTLYDKLVPLTPEQRMDTFSLKADRADVIVPCCRNLSDYYQGGTFRIYTCSGDWIGGWYYR